MMKNLLKLTTVLLLFISVTVFAQTTTYSLSHNGADELVIGIDGNFYNRDGSNVLTPATITITCETDFTGVTNFDKYNNLFVVIKNPGGTNIFSYGGLNDNNVFSDQTVDNVRTRKWVNSSIPFVNGAPPPVAGDTGSYNRSGGQTKDATNANIGSTNYDFNNFGIPIVDPSPGTEDTMPPTITLLGDPGVYVEINGSYIDDGATANDDTDGDITLSIVTVGATVDTTQEGIYVVTYNVVDAAGNSADEVKRLVFVGVNTNITVTQEPTTISNQGDLDQPLIFTISNIPVGNAVTINSRAYSSSEPTVNAGNHVGQFTNTLFNLDYDNTASYPLTQSNAVIETETTEAVDGKFNRTFTIIKHGTFTADPTTADVILAIRFVGATPNGYVFDPSLTPGSGGNSDNVSFILAPSVEYYKLSAKDFNISKFVYPNPVSSELNISKEVITDTYKVVNLLGRTIKEVRATGRLDVSDLSTGIYVLVTDAGVAKFVKK